MRSVTRSGNRWCWRSAASRSGCPEQARTQYHAALAHASNHLVTLLLDAVDALRASLRGQELLGQELVGDAPGGLAERVSGPCWPGPRWKTRCNAGRPR